MSDPGLAERALRATRSLQWARGVRAGVAVLGAMLACHLLGKPLGWAALGGFEVILVDNGGPYRSRLETMTTLLSGGAVVAILGALVSGTLVLAIAMTALVCFAATYARVASERVASTSVIILVLYFAGFGRETHTLAEASASAMQFLLGGLWAAALSLVLWPVDPFRPARNAVADCYKVLSEFTRARFTEDGFQTGTASEPGTPVVLHKEQTSDFQREMRLRMEFARRTLGTAPARVTARTVRARNLTVLLETADMFFAITMRWREMAEVEANPESDEARRSQAAVREAAQWLSGAERAIAEGLRHKPGDGAASYLPEGSHSLQHVLPRMKRPRWPFAKGTTLAHLANDERDALENVQIAFEAVRAIWSGVELRSSHVAGVPAPLDSTNPAGTTGIETDAAALQDTRWHWAPHWKWTDALRANWTHRSVMMRHALRMGIVGALDIILMRLTHVRHGTWLAMTSIIVLQPYGSGTLRRGVERVGGTIAGGILAAVLATLIHGPAALIAVITVVSLLTLATYAVNYAWYCFFLTPTFVLMSMPHFRDWQFAGVRMANTVLGAAVAVMAMRFLWPEREHLELGRLLGRGAKADAAYLRAMLQFWKVDASVRRVAERQFVAPARRLSGLAINDAEESLDRMMLEPALGRKSTSGDIQVEALTFVTYLRRLMRVATTLTVVGTGDERTVSRVAKMVARLETMGGALMGEVQTLVAASSPGEEETAGTSVEEQQMRRMERQVGVLERAAAELLGKSAG